MKILSLDPESAEGEIDIFDDLLDIVDFRESRAGRNIVAKSVNLALAALSKGFDTAVRQITHEPFHLMCGSGPLREVSEPDALNHTVNEEPASDHLLSESVETLH